MIVADAQAVAADLQTFLQKVEGGETILIAVHDRPVAELRPVSFPATRPRPFGLCAGEFVVPDDFDEPLPTNVVEDFEGR